MDNTTYEIVKYENGKRIGNVAGLGRNKGTWDCRCYSKRTAQRWLKQCRDDAKPDETFKINSW